MKAVTLLLACALMASAALAQGTINFTNIKPTKQQIFDAEGNPLTGAWAQLYAGKTADKLFPCGVPVAFYEDHKSGYFSGKVVELWFLSLGYFQVWVWKGAETFELAPQIGKSNVLQLWPGDPGPLTGGTLPSDLKGLESFSLTAVHVPEAPPVFKKISMPGVMVTGHPAEFMTIVLGALPLTYQWKKDGANIDGQTGADLALSSVAKGAAGTYSVVVTASNGGQAEASAEVKVFSLPDITLNRPVEGSTTAAITHQIKIWAIGGEDQIDVATGSITVNGVNVTANATVTIGRRGLQATVDLVENADPDTIPGLFLGYETLAAGTDNAMTVTLAFEPVGGDRVFTRSWSYTLYDASASGGSGIAKMAVNQIFQRGEDLYVIWPGSSGLMLERNSDCMGGGWESIPSTVGKGIHVEKNCGTKAFFRLVRVKE